MGAARRSGGERTVSRGSFPYLQGRLEPNRTTSRSSQLFSKHIHHHPMSTPFRQDMPPVGGFEAVRYKRNLPLRGPSGLAILGGVTALCAYGFYRVGMGNIEKRELQREKIWSRIHLVPLLLAEGDRDAYRREQAALAREREIMKGVKDWEVGKSVYNDPRYRSSEWIVAL